MRNLKFAIIIAITSFVLLLVTIVFTLILKPQNSKDNLPVVTSGGNTNVVPTYIAPPDQLKPSNGKAIIQGKICNAQGPLIITVESIPDRTKTQKFYPGLNDARTDLYYFELDPGTYNIYTENNNREKVNTYSQFVTCGLNQDFCINHNLIDLFIESTDVKTNIDICDSLWKTRFQNIPSLVPSQESDALPTPIFDPNSNL